MLKRNKVPKENRKKEGQFNAIWTSHQFICWISILETPECQRVKSFTYAHTIDNITKIQWNENGKKQTLEAQGGKWKQKDYSEIKITSLHSHLHTR